jgi:hypothetical protein
MKVAVGATVVPRRNAASRPVAAESTSLDDQTASKSVGKLLEGNS